MCDLLANFSLSDNCTSIRRAISLSPDLEQDLYKYAKDNLLWLNVYVKDSFSTNIVRDEKMTRTSFVANVGGLLGLCMGFSLVSVAEIIYYMFKRQTMVACQRGVVARQQRRAASRKKLRRNAAAASLRRLTREAASYTTTRDSGESSQAGSRKARKRKKKKQEDVSFGTTDEVSEMLRERTATVK